MRYSLSSYGRARWSDIYFGVVAGAPVLLEQPRERGAVDPENPGCLPLSVHGGECAA